MKSVIFDLDGTITNSEHLHFEAFNKILFKYGIKLTQKEFLAYNGLGSIASFKQVFEKNNCQGDSVKCSKEKSKIFIKLVNVNGLEIINGFMSFYRMLIEKKVKVIIGTSSRKFNVVSELNSIGLGKQKFVCADDVDKTKPFPDIFLLAAKELGEEPSNCVVFEDAKSGVIAGHRAGMKVIGVCQSSSLEELSDADFIIEDYSGLDWEKISKILN